MSTTNTLALRPARKPENTTRASRATREPRRKREASPEQKEAAAARRAEIRAMFQKISALPPPPPQPDRQPASDPGPIVPVLVIDTRWNLRGRLAAYVTTLHPHAPRVRCMDSITFNPARPVDSLAADLRRRCLTPARQWWASILRSQRTQTSQADALRLALNQLSHAAGAEVGPCLYGNHRDVYGTADRRFSVCDYDLTRHATGTFPDHHDQRLHCSLSLSFPALLQVLKILQADTPNQPANP